MKKPAVLHSLWEGGWLAFFVGNNPEKTKSLGMGMRRGTRRDVCTTIGSTVGSSGSLG